MKTFKELKEFIETLTEDQLNQPVIIFHDDEEYGKQLDSAEISGEDIYWEHHGDCVGTLKEVQEFYGNSWEDEIEDLTKIPKGTVTLHTI